jgi:hypothetical protein
MGFASEKAAAKDFAGAGKALDMVHQLLGAAADGGASADDASAARTPRGILPPAVYEQSGAVWVSARRKVGAELKQLETAIVQTYGDPALAEDVQRSVRRLDRVLQLFDEQIAQTLNAAAGSQDAEATRALHGQARDAIARYQAHLDDPLVRELDDNPFVPVAVRATLSTTLGALAAKLA